MPEQPTSPPRVAVLGAGAWGTALAAQAARAGAATTLWARRAEQAAEMAQTGCNARYLPGVTLPAALRYSADVQQALDGVDWVVLGVPSKACVTTAAEACDVLGARAAEVGFVLTSKGFDPSGGGLLSAPLRSAVASSSPIACLSGPSFAKEVAAGLPTAVVVAADEPDAAVSAAAIFHDADRGGTFRVYSSSDLSGVLIGGALKNPLAIAAGVCDGLGFGANARSALITRGLAEITRLGTTLGGRRQTFMGLSGMGDLVLTCSDDQSRNRRFGLALGRGSTPDEAEAAVGQTVEGRRAASAALALATRHDVELPIVAAVASVVDGQITPREAVGQLLARPPREEIEAAPQ